MFEVLWRLKMSENHKDCKSEHVVLYRPLAVADPDIPFRGWGALNETKPKLTKISFRAPYCSLSMGPEGLATPVLTDFAKIS